MNIFIPLFIFVILVSFVHRKSLQKSVKVHRPALDPSSDTRHDMLHQRPAVDLSSDTLHDILAFFNRKSLSRLRSVDSRFNQTIQREFANKPYLLLRYLSYSNKDCYVRLDLGKDIDDPKVVDQILAAKFVHFTCTRVECDDRATVMHFLSKNSNPTRMLILELSKKFQLSRFHARSIAKCKSLDSISFHGRVALLPELLLGNCHRLTVSDDLFTTADSASVPWAKILDFLFRPGGTKDRYRYIDIETKNPPNEAEFLAFTDSVRQRFLAARSPLCFYFSWLANELSFFDHIADDVKNTHTGQRLAMYQAKYSFEEHPEFKMFPW